MKNLTFVVTMKNVPDDLEAGDLASEMGDALDNCVQDWPEIRVSPIELILPGETVSPVMETARQAATPVPETLVIFRKFLDHKDSDLGDGIIALFPDIAENGPGMVLSYMHVGQHGQASLRLVYGEPRTTRPATPKEYAALKAELENLSPEPYRLRVIQRIPGRQHRQ